MKVVHESGKRKTAIARATVKPGTGIVRINNILIDNYEPDMARNKIREPLILLPSIASKVDISVNSQGGGWMSQADAIRIAISRCLVSYSNKPADKETLLNYDRNMLVADIRVKESTKPNRQGSARSRRQKSYR